MFDDMDQLRASDVEGWGGQHALGVAPREASNGPQNKKLIYNLSFYE